MYKQICYACGIFHIQSLFKEGLSCLNPSWEKQNKCDQYADFDFSFLNDLFTRFAYSEMVLNWA